MLSLQFIHIRSFACRGRLRNLRAVGSIVGLYCVTITWQKILKARLQVTVSVATAVFFTRCGVFLFHLVCRKSGVLIWCAVSSRCAEKHIKTFFGGHTKKGVHDLCGRTTAGKSCTNNFSGKFGEMRAKILRTKNRTLKMCRLLQL